MVEPLTATAVFETIRAIVGDKIEPAGECQEAWFELLRLMQAGGRGPTKTWQLFLCSAAGFMDQATIGTPSIVADRLEALASERASLQLCIPLKRIDGATYDAQRCPANHVDAARVADAFNALSPRFGFVETCASLFAVGCSAGIADQDRDAVLAYIGTLAAEYREIARREAAVTRH